MSVVEHRNGRNHANLLPETCAQCRVSRTTEWICINAQANTVLASARRLATYQVGETLFHQHDAPQGVYCLMSGLVILKQLDSFGNETAFRLLFPGQTCGWRSLFAEQNHAASAVVLETAKVCLIHRDDIDRMMVFDSSLPRRFLQTLACDRGPVDAVLLRNSFLPAHIRLAHLLLILSEHCLGSAADGQLCYRLPVKRKHIAALIGTSGETVSRAIKTLEDESLAVFEHRNVLIPDVSRLRRKIS